MLSTATSDESQEALVTPLLISSDANITSNSTTDEDDPVAVIGPQLSSNSIISSNTGLWVSSSEHDMVSRRMMDPRFCPPVVQGLVFRFLAIKCAADVLPSIFHSIVTNGKIAVAGFIAVYLIFLSLWFPFWLLSFLCTEWGVYVAAILFVFIAGRSIIRMIAFPGASRKVSLDMEREFSKYAIRMLVTSAETVREAAVCLMTTTSANPGPSYEMLPGVWKRAELYRNRVLSVIAETLMVLYRNQNAESFRNPDSNNPNPDLTKCGNNRLQGDMGNLSSVTPEARANGLELMKLLEQYLTLLDHLERAIVLHLQGGERPTSLAPDALATATEIVRFSAKLIDFCNSMGAASAEGQQVSDQGTGDSDEEDPIGSMRRNFGGNNGSPWEALKGGFSSLISMLDPSLHFSVFNFDVQRGCLLSRYRGSRQMWIRRPQGGMIDVLHFPAKNHSNGAPNTRAILYCNPNAGLIEVCAGMSFSGGNVPAAGSESNANLDSWTDFYTDLGLDVYVFNYAGYGRSYGTSLFARGNPAEIPHIPGWFPRLRRIFRSSFLSFRPTPDTLRADGIAVAEHLLNQAGIEKLFLHGESIGGVSATGTAKHLSVHPMTRGKLSLLICDRTFCNLEAVAQRLVGGWTGYAIRTLTLFSWSTDVAGDFLAAACPKVVANDAADAIIADEASLKSGVALWKEIHRGISSTKGIGWIQDAPLQYRMADYENVCVNDSRYVAQTSLVSTRVPVWPTDKHISAEEAFHFAACCKRIGKVATKLRKSMPVASEEGIEMSDQSGSLPTSDPLVVDAWKYLSTCDGMIGASLGAAVKRGFDSTVSWLCALLTFGGQVVVTKAESRLGRPLSGMQTTIDSSDFDTRPPGYLALEGEGTLFTKPIPEVVNRLVSLRESGDSGVSQLAHEFDFIIGMLQYVHMRLSSPISVESSLRNRQLKTNSGGVGNFLHLHCGHNSAYSMEERLVLKQLVEEALHPSNPQMTIQPV